VECNKYVCTQKRFGAFHPKGIGKTQKHGKSALKEAWLTACGEKSNCFASIVVKS
jgi:hypothetical protein